MIPGHNKGKRYIFCKECNRKRYCSKKSKSDDYREWTCTLGHSWIVKLPTLERLNNTLLELIIPKVKKLFERDDIFYKNLKK